MDEREISAVTRISPIKKLAVARPAVGSRELAYKLKQYDKKQKNTQPGLRQLIDPAEPEAEKSKVIKSKAPKDLPETEDFRDDIKRRMGFDRARLIGDDD